MEHSPSKHFTYQKESLKKDAIEGKTFSFEDPDQHKSTRLKINRINRILGYGSYSSWVAEVNVELETDTSSEKKTHNMVIKRYREKGTDALENLKKSHRNYKKIKEIGIPTWDTYRINEEHKMALMTLGIKGNEILLTANDTESVKKESFKENPIEKIENLDEFIIKVALILEKVNTNGYRLNVDSWGIVFKPQPNNPGVYRLDVIISDVDSLDSSDDPSYRNHYENIKQDWERENRRFVSSALLCIFPGDSSEKIAFEKSVLSRINLKKSII